MTHPRDAATAPLVFLSFSAPSWLGFLHDFWSVLLPSAGATLLGLQIAYYWKMLHK